MGPKNKIYTATNRKIDKHTQKKQQRRNCCEKYILNGSRYL